MKLAAIDIGSNAIRLQVTRTIRTKDGVRFKKIEYIRFPLRLGKDVFNTGEISDTNERKFKKLMKSFSILIDLYEVDDYMACATSAMREAKNGRQLAKKVEQKTGLKINIINGPVEASMINNAISSFLENDKNYIHIDVGGGSTELNILQNGNKVCSRSFQIGSVRRLEHHDSPQLWNKMEKWVKAQTKTFANNVFAVGTGGNINKIFDLAGKLANDPLMWDELKDVQQMLRKMSIEQRIADLDLNPDRADVILPASEIYEQVMLWSGAERILVPDVGLKDGIMQQLYDRNAYKQ